MAEADDVVAGHGAWEIVEHPRDLQVAGLGRDLHPSLLVDPCPLAEDLPGRREVRLEYRQDVEGNAHDSPSSALGTALGSGWWHVELSVQSWRAGGLGG
jgi:hypothetical protein